MPQADRHRARPSAPLERRGRIAVLHCRMRMGERGIPSRHDDATLRGGMHLSRLGRGGRTTPPHGPAVATRHSAILITPAARTVGEGSAARESAPQTVKSPVPWLCRAIGAPAVHPTRPRRTPFGLTHGHAREGDDDARVPPTPRKASHHAATRPSPQRAQIAAADRAPLRGVAPRRRDLTSSRPRDPRSARPVPARRSRAASSRGARDVCVLPGGRGSWPHSASGARRRACFM
jgi:hypothetical protein